MSLAIWIETVNPYFLIYNDFDYTGPNRRFKTGKFNTFSPYIPRDGSAFYPAHG
jgi:hypothetical protein